MTFRGVPVPLLAGLVFALGIVAISVFMAVRTVSKTSNRCNPQGACVDVIDGPYVLRRLPS